MPIYVFKDNNSGEVFEKLMPMSEREEYLKENPHISQMPVALNIGYTYQTKKIDSGFKEVLQKINDSGVVDKRKSKLNELL